MKRSPVVAFFDFDNTITTFDILDDMMERFSKDDSWKALEEKWQKGAIGSKECLDGQIRGIRITKRALDKYLASKVRIDPGFRKLVRLCDARGIKKIIVSDNFDYILKSVLKKNGIKGFDVYCNSLTISGDRLKPRYPHHNRKCGTCAHCKTKSFKANADKAAATIYVGDGLSDACPSKRASVVFAKGSLKRQCAKSGVACVPFERLDDVYSFLTRRIS